MIVMTGERSIDPIPDATENLYSPSPPSTSACQIFLPGDKRTLCEVLVFLVSGVCLGKAIEPKDLFKTCPLPKTSYLLSKPFILNVYYLSHNDTFPRSFV